MPEIIQYLVKLSISLTAVYLFYILILRRLTFYQWNRWYLLLYSVLCFLLPLMNIYWWMEEEKSSGVIMKYVPAIGNWNPSVPVESTWTSWDYCLLILSAGVTLMMARLLLQYFSLIRLYKRAKLLVDEDIQLYEVNESIIPFSFGSAVFINPSQHNETELKEIIRHEMVHVRQKHTIDIIFSELLLAMNWFNPFAWLLRSAIRQNLEFIADMQVLKNGLDRRQYQHLLLKVIGQQQFSIASHLNFSALKTRIAMMNKIRTARVHLLKFAFALPIAAILLLAFRREKQQQAAATENILPTSLKRDTVPAVPNNKGYYLTIADNNGECIVIIKDKNYRLVKAITLTDWNQDSATMESTYGKIPPPPAVPVPPVAPIPAEGAQPVMPSLTMHPPVPVMPGMTSPETLEPLEPMEAMEPPAPPPAPIMPAGVKSMQIVNNQVNVQLKNGKSEKYDLRIPVQKAAFEKKYGKMPGHPTPVPAPRQMPAPAGSGTVIKINVEPAVIEYQKIISEPVINVNTNIKSTIQVEKKPLIIMEGKIISKSDMEMISPEKIQSVQILKGELAAPYGEIGKNGVVLISLREPSGKTVVSNPVYYIDGIESEKQMVDKTNPEEIERMEVLKGPEAIQKIGEKGKNGAIFIFKKKEKKTVKYNLFNPFKPQEYRIKADENKKDKC
jgi:hypothetical protein